MIHLSHVTSHIITINMAKPIELGLILDGKDALAFHRYIQNPIDTPEGRKLLMEAYEEVETLSLI